MTNGYLIALSISLWILIALPVGYLLLLALASIRTNNLEIHQSQNSSYRFILVIPAHNEEKVIQSTIYRLQSLNYPKDMYQIHIVADHCNDQTVIRARLAEAVVHERESGERSGKGAALSWFFDKILTNRTIDAIVVFDADTHVDQNYLRVMSDCLSKGYQIIQGQHIIRNPLDGWFPSLVWAMFMIDNRFQNLGRSNLGWSAKNMGDSICCRADILRKLGWGKGLTEDYQLRQRLLLEGVRIKYEPRAIGYGEAPRTWRSAQSQRARWLRGTREASQMLLFQMLHKGFCKKDLALLDGAVQAILPSYSTLTLLIGFLLFSQLAASWIFALVIPPPLIAAWAGLLGIIFIYPFFGLALEHAPFRGFLVILSGPVYILWRSYLAFRSRFIQKNIVWIRTPHG